MSSRAHVAIVADWMTDLGGAERVVLALHEAFPDAPIYTSVYEPSPNLAAITNGLDIRTTWLQRFPRWLRRLQRWFPVLRVWAFRSLDLSDYGIIISSSSAESKQVRKTRTGQVHICYCHTPVRYYWDQYEQYRQNPGYGPFNWLIRLLMPLFVPPLKRADYAAAQAVDVFIANSSAVAQRIKQYYDRDSTILNPPVQFERFASAAQPKKRRGFLAGGRQVPYKRYDLAIQVCSRLGLPLTVYGGGPEHERLKAMAGPTISFAHNPTDGAVTELFASAEAYLFCAEEDFGIVQVEALAAGTPVIAYARGGSRDIITRPSLGVLFDSQTPEALEAAITTFQARSFDRVHLQSAAQRFATEEFIAALQHLVREATRR